MLFKVIFKRIKNICDIIEETNCKKVYGPFVRKQDCWLRKVIGNEVS
jgi:hypothetical protein